MSPKRVGASSYAMVTTDLRSALERGELECATHVEQMAINMRTLAESLFGPVPAHYDLEQESFVGRMRAGGQLVYELFGDDLWDLAPSWRADVARCWAAMAIEVTSLGVADAVRVATRSAEDPHFGVREFAWLGIRGRVRSDTPAAIQLLAPLGSSSNPLLRRFAVEAARPISVWGVHLPVLKAEPERGRPLIDQFRCESDRYAGRSVSNWLRDASRSNPGWVAEFVRRWRSSCGCASTQRICTSAAR